MKTSQMIILFLFQLIILTLTVTNHLRTNNLESSVATAIKMSDKIVVYNDAVLEHNKAVVDHEKLKLQKPVY